MVLEAARKEAWARNKKETSRKRDMERKTTGGGGQGDGAGAGSQEGGGR